jgi:iron complex outermembrane receptor protein
LSFFKNTILVRPEFRIESWHFSSSGKAQIAGVPSTSASIQVNKNQKIELGIYAKLRNPGLNDLYWPGAGNPALQSEKGFTSNLDWKVVLRETEKLKISQHLGIYESRIHNYILWRPDFGVWKPSNIGSVILRGLVFNPEFSYRASSKLQFSANLETRISAQKIYKSIGDGQEAKPLPFSPNFQASAFFRASFTRFSGFIRFFHCGSRNIDTEGRQKLQAYQLVDSGIEFQASEETGLHFFGSISNLFNARYTQMPGYPMPGRNFNTGMKINF